MQFRDLKTQRVALKSELDEAIIRVIERGDYINGKEVGQLERVLEKYTGGAHCIACANGTDALIIALMTLGVGAGDGVFIPDFTFAATAEAVLLVGATPIFVDIDESFNMCPASLQREIDHTKGEGKLRASCVIPVDLFGLPADYGRILPIAQRENLFVIEDGAQGFGASVGAKRTPSFGDISTTSFFPAKPLGCYGDGGAMFTDDDNLAEVMRSICAHGKGVDKYDNVRLGMNSRLDTLQAAILLVKFSAYERELEMVAKVADRYADALADKNVRLPVIPVGNKSCFAQYCVLFETQGLRQAAMERLKQRGIPCTVYYKPLSEQHIFRGYSANTPRAHDYSGRILALPMGPYMSEGDVLEVANAL